MGLRLYNTISRKIEEFISVEPGHVKLYVCGPTVYDLLHVGNFRGAVFFNFVRHWLEHLGYRVTFLYNYTDVDDKIIRRAREEGVPASEISTRYITEFKKDFKRLHLRSHEHNPKVTDHMGDIIALIERLAERGVAYVSEGEVIFSIDKFPLYGKLSGKKIEELEAGARVEVNAKKRNPLDFVLWKPSKPDEPSWDSPWGPGRPGWHIECTAMIFKLLGERIDIHGGGIDLIFPHHENEIAQAEAASGTPYVKYWMHNNFIHFDDEKMSKSKGNVVTARVFFQDYHPEVMKYMMLSVHYRSMLNFSKTQIYQAIGSLARIYEAIRAGEEILESSGGARGDDPAPFAGALDALKRDITEAVNEDFNTPVLFAKLFEAVRLFNAEILNTKDPGVKKAVAALFMKWVAFFGGMMSLFLEPPSEFLRALDDILLREKQLDRAVIDQKVQARVEARARKDFKKADAIRDELAGLGVEIRDTPAGTSWEVRKGE
ncbi:MAG: cysteine--tRNA ligase [Candidatus Omnitrophota bacterium]